MNSEEGKKWVELLIDKSEALRAAGVLRVQLGEVSVELTPAISPEDGGFGDYEEGMFSDALDDPGTYPGGRVPKMRHRRRHQ